jgi:hypothetical protein
MADPVKKDDALATAVRDAFQKHMEQARLAAMAPKPEAAPAVTKPAETAQSAPSMPAATGLPKARLQPPLALNDVAERKSEEDTKENKATAIVTASDKEPAQPVGEQKDPLRKLPPKAPSRLDPAMRQQAELAPSGLATLLAEEAKSTPPVVPADPATASEAPSERRALRSDTLSVDRPAPRIEAYRSRSGPTEIKFDTLLNTETAPTNRTGERRASGPGPTPRREVARDVSASPEKPLRTVEARPPSRVRAQTALYMIGAVAALALVGVGTMLVLRPPAPQQAVAPSPVQPLKPTVAVDPTKAQTVVTRQVKTTAIKLDSVDLAVQEARERIAAGEVDYARLMLSGLQGTGDARVMMAMGETFDPALTHKSAAANPQLAIRFYEAAQKAGYPGAAERIARLTAKAN